MVSSPIFAAQVIKNEPPSHLKVERAMPFGVIRRTPTSGVKYRRLRYLSQDDNVLPTKTNSNLNPSFPEYPSTHS